MAAARVKHEGRHSNAAGGLALSGTAGHRSEIGFSYAIIRIAEKQQNQQETTLRAWPDSRPHPLSERAVLEETLRTQPGRVPWEVVADLTPWVESLQGEPARADERTRLLFALDEAGQRPARESIERYLLLPDEPLMRRRLSADLRGFWSALLDAYGELLIAVAAGAEQFEPPLLAQLSVRAMRAAQGLARWDALLHAAADERVWPRISLAVRVAAKAGVERLPVRLRADRETCWTVKGELARAMAWHGAGIDQLDALQQETAARLLNYVLAEMDVSCEPSTTSLCWLDLEEGRGPLRVLGVPTHGANTRFLTTLRAADALLVLQDQQCRDQLSAGFLLPQDEDGRTFAGVLSHLARLWSGEVPMRRHRRHTMGGEVLVVAGFDAVLAQVQGQTCEPLSLQVRDASLNGLGIEAPAALLAPLPVGSLLALRMADAERWRLAVVRRVLREGARGVLGLEFLAEWPVAAQLDDGERRIGALLLDPPGRGQAVRLLLPPMPRQAKRALFLLEQHRAHKLLPLPGREFGADHELRTCLVAG